jgi:hypothetical protein
LVSPRLDFPNSSYCVSRSFYLHFIWSCEIYFIQRKLNFINLSWPWCARYFWKGIMLIGACWFVGS